MSHQYFEIVAHQRFTTGKPNLGGAHRACLGNQITPGIGIELGTVFGKIDGVVAKRTMQRAAISQLGK